MNQYLNHTNSQNPWSTGRGGRGVTAAVIFLASCLISGFCNPSAVAPVIKRKTKKKYIGKKHWDCRLGQLFLPHFWSWFSWDRTVVAPVYHWSKDHWTSKKSTMEMCVLNESENNAFPTVSTAIWCFIWSSVYLNLTILTGSQTECVISLTGLW